METLLTSMLGGGERGKRKVEPLLLGRERELLRSVRCPLCIEEASNTGPFDLVPSDFSGVSKWQGTLTLSHSFS
jgi:hypothetical protein